MIVISMIKTPALMHINLGTLTVKGGLKVWI